VHKGWCSLTERCNVVQTGGQNQGFHLKKTFFCKIDMPVCPDGH